MNKIKVFLSYSYEDTAHNEWVEQLAMKIEEQKEIHLIFDKFDLSYKNEKNLFMEQSVEKSDLIIIVASENYVNKANERKGGVGIETGLIAARHYSEIDEKGESSIIPILRNNPAKTLPTYLKDLKLRLDLDKYTIDKKIKELKDIITNTSTLKRPPKKNELTDFKKSFSCADKLISINYKNRMILNENQNEKDKYQFWECSNPAKLYFLALFPSSTLKTALVSFIKNNTDNIPEQITVLKEKDSNTIEKYFKEELTNPPVIYEYSYSKYLWDQCIDQNFKKKERISTEPNYIPQDIYFYEEKENYSKKTPVGNDYINKFIENEDNNSILMILATAGKGKTTLIEHYIDEIHFSNNVNNFKKCIYISSETFKDFYKNNTTALTNIDTIYELFNAYNIYNSNRLQIDQTLFEAALSNGNFVVIVDGLDEIITLYQEKFNLEKFLDSLEKLNKDFGKCKIIITSRIFYWKNNEQRKKREHITSLVLHGFDKDHTKRYLKKRIKTLENNEFAFFTHKEEENYKDTIMNLVEEVIDFTEKEKLSPFIIDIICTTVEKQIKENKNGLKIDDNYTYPCNNDVIDKIIFSILSRESLRQNYEYMMTNDIVEIIIELALKYGKVFSSASLLEEIKNKNDSISEKVHDSFRYSQFFQVTDDTFIFKYDILVNYFKCLYILKLFTNPHEYNISEKELSGLYKIDNPIFNDITKYFRKNKTLFFDNAKIVLKELILNYKKENISNYKKSLIEESICSILYILLEINDAHNLSNKERIELIKKLYDAKDRISYLFIYEQFYPLDFSNLELWHSHFDHYKNFFNSNFYNTNFIYSITTGMQASREKRKIFDNINFDETCELFNLKENVGIQSDEIIIRKIHSFLNNFYKENFKEFIIHQKNDSQENENKISVLMAFNLIEISQTSKSFTSYIIKENRKASIRKFLKELTLDYDLSLAIRHIKDNNIHI